jgi:hypothetical protein
MMNEPYIVFFSLWVLWEDIGRIQDLAMQMFYLQISADP